MAKKPARSTRPAQLKRAQTVSRVKRPAAQAQRPQTGAPPNQTPNTSFTPSVSQNSGNRNNMRTGNTKPGSAGGAGGATDAGSQTALAVNYGDTAHQWAPGRQYPVMPQISKRSPLLEALGAPGTAILQGIIANEDYNPDFYWRDAVEIYDQMMRSDAQVFAIVQMMELPIRRATWTIEPGTVANDPDAADDAGVSDAEDLQGDKGDPKAKEIAAFIESCLFHDLRYTTVDGRTLTQKWDDVLRHALMMIRFGFSGFEKVWREEDGWVKLARLTPLLPTSFWRWWVGPDNELVGVQQYTYQNYTYRYIDIPADKLLLFHHRMEGNNYQGYSVLRSIYKHWYYKDQLYKIDAIGMERNAIAVPYIKLPITADETQLTNAQAILANLRVNSTMGATILHDWELGYIPGSQHYAGGALKSIEHHDMLIARGVLAQFMNLGSNETGSYALADAQIETFLENLQAEAAYVEDVFNNDLIPQLVDFNYTGVQAYPKLKCSNLANADIVAVTDAIAKLKARDASFLTPGPELEDWIRDQIGMPRAPRSEIVRANPTAPTNPARPDVQPGDHTTQQSAVKQPAQAQGQGQGQANADAQAAAGEDQGEGGDGGGAASEPPASDPDTVFLREALAFLRDGDAVDRGLNYPKDDPRSLSPRAPGEAEAQDSYTLFNPNHDARGRFGASNGPRLTPGSGGGQGGGLGVERLAHGLSDQDSNAVDLDDSAQDQEATWLSDGDGGSFTLFNPNHDAHGRFGVGSNSGQGGLGHGGNQHGPTAQSVISSGGTHAAAAGPSMGGGGGGGGAPAHSGLNSTGNKPVDVYWKGLANGPSASITDVTVEARNGVVSITVHHYTGQNDDHYTIEPDATHGGYQITDHQSGAVTHGLSYSALDGHMKGVIAPGLKSASRAYTQTKGHVLQPENLLAPAPKPSGVAAPKAPSAQPAAPRGPRGPKVLTALQQAKADLATQKTALDAAHADLAAKQTAKDAAEQHLATLTATHASAYNAAKADLENAVIAQRVTQAPVFAARYQQAQADLAAAKINVQTLEADAKSKEVAYNVAKQAYLDDWRAAYPGRPAYQIAYGQAARRRFPNTYPAYRAASDTYHAAEAKVTSAKYGDLPRAQQAYDQARGRLLQNHQPNDAAILAHPSMAQAKIELDAARLAVSTHTAEVTAAAHALKLATTAHTAAEATYKQEQFTAKLAKLGSTMPVSGPVAGKWRGLDDVPVDVVERIQAMQTPGAAGAANFHGINKVAGEVQLNALQKELGFDGQAEVRPDAEISTLKGAGEKEVWRGDTNLHGDYTGQFMHGDLHTGGGIYGHGTYIADNKSTASDYANGTYNRSSNGKVMRMTIKTGARITDFNHLENERRSAQAKAQQDLANARRGTLAYRRASANVWLTSTTSYYALAHGWDGLRVQNGTRRGKPELQYTWLNRTALRISSVTH